LVDFVDEESFTVTSAVDESEDEEEEDIRVRVDKSLDFIGLEARRDDVESWPTDVITALVEVVAMSSSLGKTLHSFAFTINCAIGSSKSVKLKGITAP
jgi:hypothetical protein